MKTGRHIWMRVFMACFCLGINLSWAEDGHRVFIGAEGRSISGKLVGYNPDEQIATIKRNDDKKFWVSLDVFSETDQQYIREQGPVMNFIHSVRIVPILREFDSAGRYDETRYEAEYVKSLGYVVSLENRSLTLFEEVEIEYCLFYRQRERHAGRMDFSHGVQCGRWELGSMVPGSRHVVETKNVLIYDQDSKCSVFGDDGRAKGGVEGIWLRIVATLPRGDRITRELQSPAHVGKYHKWTVHTAPAGLNK